MPYPLQLGLQDTTLPFIEEELKSLLMNVKETSEKVVLNSEI